MSSSSLKSISYFIYLIAFGCGVLLLTNRTFGYGTAIRMSFYIFGAIALLISFINSKMNADKSEFNILFWMGSLILFIGLVLKTLHLQFYLYVVILGMAFTAISYFFNPNGISGKKDDSLLDN